MTAKRDAGGIASRNRSTYFWLMPGAWLVSPVTLPPGRARLATSPCSTGSGTRVMTTGILEVALFTARVSGVHLRLEEGPHEAGEALGFALGQRHRGGEVAPFDIVQLAHLVQKALPDARRRGRSAERRNPTREALPVGCARPACGAPSTRTAAPDRNARRLTRSPDRHGPPRGGTACGPASREFSMGSPTMVPKGGLEPPRVAPHAPQTCASANSATSAPARAQYAVPSRGLSIQRPSRTTRPTRDWRRRGSSASRIPSPTRL